MKNSEQTISLVENYTECWKQFHHYLQLVRAKKFEREDESQFLELKSVLAQQFELVIAAVDCKSPAREEVHKLLTESPSLKYLTEMDSDAVRMAEARWHKIYIALQSILGQLKVAQNAGPVKAEPGTGGGWSFFRKAST
jgi:lipopolysaccharide biosynthesis regulator YciM